MSKIKFVIAAVAVTFAIGYSADGVKIGEQVWAPKNSDIKVKGSTCYNDDAEMCKKYGRLYTWKQAKKACPKGWHLPTDDEWKTLKSTLGNPSKAATELTAKEGWNDYKGKKVVASDIYGWSALPGGMKMNKDKFYDVGKAGYWWSATEYAEDTAPNWKIENDNSAFIEYNHEESFLSVRCLKN
ncbi:hypothetical protein AGMMS49938_14370 [Fibrobacterales bacterium]|nr:hypothetical protein AGMMS49938_14370 [Fibrobacterales bacterium]